MGFVSLSKYIFLYIYIYIYTCICIYICATTPSIQKYSGLFRNRTFPEKRKISPESEKNWAFRLDGRVWLSATIVRKSPLYFGMEGVLISFQISVKLREAPHRPAGYLYYSLHSEIQWTFSDDRRAQQNSAVESESSILNLGQLDREFRSFN